MRFAVLAALESWYLRDLARAAAGRFEIVPLAFSQIGSRIVSPGPCELFSGEQTLNACDAVIVRTMPPGSLEQVIFRMDALGRLEAAGTVVMNPPRAIEMAVDKFLTSAKLHEAGLLTPRTIVCQNSDDAMAAFAALGNDVVLKPLFGSEGRGITRLTDEALALRAFRMLEQLGAVLYLQEFIPHHGHDLRLFVLGERVFGMRRSNPSDWRTNVSRGATTAPFTPTETQLALALRAASAVGAPIAGVDVLPGQDGRDYLLEVNAVPGWKALAKTLGIDMAALVLNFVADRS